jgi:outer membrane protein assembly factor BamA
MIKYFLLFISLSAFIGFAQTQDTIKYIDDYSVKIDSIKIIGNEITEDFIILKELNFSAGDTLTPRVAEYCRERVYSLGIFNLVNIFPETIGSRNYAVITVEEGWYIYPVPFLEVRDNDWRKISYGAILVVKNFRGRNQTISLRGAFGYDPFLNLMYYDPWFIKDEAISFGLSLSYGSTANKSNIAAALHGEDFDQLYITGAVETGKRFGLYNRLSMSLGYSVIETPFYIKGISASQSRIDHVPYMSFSYSYDTRDLVQFPRDGLFGGANAVFKGLGNDGINYNIFSIDFREYRKLMGDLHAKWRFATRFTGGKLVPYYDLSFIGYEERIRGHFYDVMEGNNYYTGSMELYYPLLKDTHIDIDFVPLLPRALLSYRIAFYAELFGDTGATKFKGESLSINDFKSGYGGGLIFLILPYNVLRFEVGLDEYRNTEFIFNVTASF